jgi:hypothetical protein
MEKLQNLIIDGMSYSVNQFSPQLQQTVAFYEALLQEGEDLNLEVAALQFKMDTNKAATMFIHGQLAKQAKDELEMLKTALAEKANQESTD